MARMNASPIGNALAHTVQARHIIEATREYT